MNKKEIILICMTAIAAIVIIPLLINYFIQIPAVLPIVGEPVNWLMFWPTYLGAVASSVMIFVTYMTLKQNKEQLQEMKRQWDEEHKPQLAAHIYGYGQLFYIRVKNISKVSVNKVSMSFTHDPQNEFILNYDAWKQKLSNINFSIEPNDFLDIEVPASFYIGEIYTDFIGLSFSFNDSYQYNVNLYFAEATVCNFRFENQALLETIDKVSETIKNKTI